MSPSTIFTNGPRVVADLDGNFGSNSNVKIDALHHDDDTDDTGAEPQEEGENEDEDERSYVLHRSLEADPLRVTGSQGNYLHLDNGQTVFDATGGAAVACLGHGDVRVQHAIIEQMSQNSYCHTLFYATHAAEDLAKFLIESTHNEFARAFFISSGSEAAEAALKMARQYHLEKRDPEPQRTHFISRQQSYHGTTIGSLSIGGHLARRALFEPLLSPNTSRVSPCFPYRGMEVGESNQAYVQRLEADLEAEFQRVGPRKIAAFIAEPIVGAALGCAVPVPGYFKAIRRVCDRHGALLIFDEVMSGTGRTGPEPSTKYPNPLHAYQDPLIGVTPDILTMGKALGGGYMPIAGMLASLHIVQTLRRGSGAFSHGQTYQGHPLACAAALAVQRIILADNLVANVREQGALLGKLLKENLASHPHVGDIRGKGLFWGIEFVVDKQTKEAFPVEKGVAWGVHCLGMKHPHNMSIYPGTGSADAGKRGDHVILAPAYNITSEEIRTIVKTVTNVVKEYFAVLGEEEEEEEENEEVEDEDEEKEGGWVRNLSKGAGKMGGGAITTTNATTVTSAELVRR